MAEQNNEKIITTDTLYTFKLEQDLQNLEKFKLKNDSTDLKGAVRYDAAQVLEDTQKQQARANIGAADESVVIRFDKAQDLTPEQKAQARANIGAGTGDGTGSGVSDYDELLNRPIYDDRVISNYSYEETPNPVSFDCADTNYSFYKVSDLVLTKEDIFNTQITINNKYKLDKFSQSNVLIEADELIIVQELVENGWAFCFCNTVGTCTLTFSGATISVNVPETGIYRVNILGMGMSDISTIEILVSGELKQLDDKYIPNNIARLNESGIIPAENLPSYVDDVIEGYMIGDVNLNFYSEKDADGNYLFPILGEKGKIYIDLETGNTYRWSGSQYVQMNPPEYTLASNEDIYALFNK